MGASRGRSPRCGCFPSLEQKPIARHCQGPPGDWAQVPEGPPPDQIHPSTTGRRAGKVSLRKTLGRLPIGRGAMTDVGEPRPQGLLRGVVGFRGGLFQSITFMAPAIATAFSIPAGIAFSGGGAPLSGIFALVASLLAAGSIGQLSKHIPTAGPFYTYVSNGLHPAVGFLVGWGFLLGILVGGPFLALQMGFVVAGTTNSEGGWSPDLWWVWTVLVCLLVFVLGYRGIVASTGAGIVLGAFEILVFVALSLTLIVQAGGDNTLKVFGTTYANNPDYSGFSGVIVGSIFTILAFIGFEEAAPIAEEAHEPHRT